MRIPGDGKAFGYHAAEIAGFGPDHKSVWKRIGGGTDRLAATIVTRMGGDASRAAPSRRLRFLRDRAWPGREGGSRPVRYLELMACKSSAVGKSDQAKE